MTQGRFIQAGVDPVPSGMANEGYGEFMTVDKLAQLERARIRKRLTDIRPDLLEDGVRVTRAKIETDAKAEKLRADLHGALGGDSVRVALAILKEDAAKAIALDAIKAAAQPAPKK